MEIKPELIELDKLQLKREMAILVSVLGKYSKNINVMNDFFYNTCPIKGSFEEEDEIKKTSKREKNESA